MPSVPVGQEHYGYEKYWEDISIPGLSMKAEGTNDPTLLVLADNGAASRGVWGYGFAAGAVNELFFSCELPDSYYQGDDLRFHVHWSPSDGAAGNVIWGIESTIAYIGQAIPNTTIVEQTEACGGGRNHQYTPNWPMTNVGGMVRHQSVIHGRIYRDGASDTYATFAFLWCIGVHYRVDTPGVTSRSDNEWDKMAVI